jgi:hypothetical protein
MILHFVSNFSDDGISWRGQISIWLESDNDACFTFGLTLSDLNSQSTAFKTSTLNITPLVFVRFMDSLRKFNKTLLTNIKLEHSIWKVKVECDVFQTYH